MSDKFYTLLSIYAYRDKVFIGLAAVALFLVLPLLHSRKALRNLAAWLDLLVIIITLVKSLTI